MTRARARVTPAITQMELTSVFRECPPGKRKLVVKVVNIFGNDTRAIIEVNVSGKTG